MFARVSTFAGAPDGLDRFVREAEEKVIPTAGRLGGFRGMLALGDRATGRSISITIWDTEQAMTASEQAADKLREQTAPASGYRVVGVERFEVLLNRPL